MSTKIPDPSGTGSSWNCKFKISVDESLLNLVDTSKNGYTSILIESYGFDEDVFMIV